MKAILLAGERVTDMDLSAIANKNVLVKFLADLAVNVDPDDEDPNVYYFDHRDNEFRCTRSQLRLPDGRPLGPEHVIVIPNVGIVRVGATIRIRKLHRDDSRVPLHLDGRHVKVTKIHLEPEKYIIITLPDGKGVYAVVPENVTDIINGDSQG